MVTRPGNCLSVVRKCLLWPRIDKFQYEKPVPIDTIRLLSVYQWRPSYRRQFSVPLALLTSAGPVLVVVPDGLV